MALSGRVAVAFEILCDARGQDMLSDIGYANALYVVGNLNPEIGAQLTAPVCSTWVFVSRGSTFRTHSTHQTQTN